MSNNKNVKKVANSNPRTQALANAGTVRRTATKKKIEVLPVIEPSKKKEKQLKQKLEHRQKVMKGAGDYAEDKAELRKKYNKAPKVKQQKEKEWWESGVDTLLTVGKQLLPLIAAGFGDYEIHSNSLMAAGTNGKIGGEVPYMHSTDEHTTIRHREFLGDVLGSTLTYASTQIPLNPGLALSFPWASPMCNCFQMYRIRGAIIEFKSLSLEFAAVPYNGFVAIGTQYDVLEPLYTGKLELDNSEYACSGPPFQSLIHPIECERSQTFNTELFVRNGSIPTNADLRLYDWGTTSVAVGSQTSNAVIGELWITYEIDLFKPKLASQVGYSANSAQATTNGCSAANPLGTGYAGGWTGTLPMSVAVSGTVLRFSPLVTAGQYYVTFSWLGPGNAAVTYPAFSFINCTGSNLLVSPQTGATAQIMTYSTIVTVIAQSANIVLGTAGVFPTGALNCLICISQVSAIGLEGDDVLCRKRVWERHLPPEHKNILALTEAFENATTTPQDDPQFHDWLVENMRATTGVNFGNYTLEQLYDEYRRQKH